jgi:pimeloyl-ACP methyl ester carboxylesterase
MQRTTVPLPPGLIIPVPGRGEMFMRDTHPQGGGERGTVLLLHGWLAGSDVNWWPLYEPLRRAGWRVMAVDARGHGRGLRPEGAFRIALCADDLAALLNVLCPGKVVVVGYSMGGAIAQVMSYRYPELLRGVVLCATASEWREAPQLRVAWYGMSALQLGWRLAPRRTWSAAVRLVYGGHAPSWFSGELARGAPWDIAEAGREMSRFDSRPWLHGVRVPAAVIATTDDVLVPLSRQRALARALDAPVIELTAGHLAALTAPNELFAALCEALDIVAPRSRRRLGIAPVAEELVRARPLRRGERGELVAEAQRMLAIAGDSAGQIDGMFGPATEAAVRRFQRGQGLPAGGRVDARTWEALTDIAERGGRRRRRTARRAGATVAAATKPGSQPGRRRSSAA